MKTKHLIVILILSMLLATACDQAAYTPPMNGSSAAATSTQEKAAAAVDPDGGKETKASMEREKSEYQKTHSGESKSEKTGVGAYKDYSPAAVTAEQKAGQKVVLFFHANWCPTCQASDSAFRANPEKIPAGVTVLKLDYDTQTALKQKYGVVYQHTFVQIDNNSNLVALWIGDADMLAKEIK